MSPPEFLPTISQHQDELKAQTESGEKEHVTLEKTLTRADLILDDLMSNLATLRDTTGLQEDEIFNEPWEITLCEEIIGTYQELLDLDEISQGEDLRSHVEQGVMSAEANLIQDLILIQRLVEAEIQTIILEQNEIVLAELETVMDSPEIRAKTLLLEISNAIILNNLEGLTRLEEKFDDFCSDPAPKSEEVQEYIDIIQEYLNEAQAERERRLSFHVLKISREQLALFNKASQGTGIHDFQLAKVLGMTYKTLKAFLGTAFTGKFMNSRAERYRQPVEMHVNDPEGWQTTLNNRFQLIAGIERAIESGEATSIEDALEHCQAQMSTPDTTEFGEYLVECEKVPGRLDTSQQHVEMARLHEIQQEYHQKRNYLAENFEQPIFKEGPVTFTFDFEDKQQEITVSSLAELDLIISEIIYTYDFPRLINQLTTKARQNIDEDALVSQMREIIWDSWGIDDPEAKDIFLQNRKLERLLRASVAHIVDTKVEEEIIAMVRDDMIKQMVSQHKETIQSRLITKPEMEAFDEFIESGFTSLKLSDFELSDEWDDIIESEGTQMIAMFAMIKYVQMLFPRALVDKLIKPLQTATGGKYRSGLNTVVYALLSQTIDNAAVYILYGGSLSAGEWGMGHGTRVYYELFSRGIYRGTR